MTQQGSTSQLLAVLSAAFSGEERAMIIQAMQGAKARGPEELAKLMSQVRASAEARLGPGALALRRPPAQ